MLGRFLLLGSALVFAQAPQDSLSTTGRNYESFMGRWTRQLAPELIRFANLGEPQKVLDYGCATGAIALRVATRFPHTDVTGVDPSASLLEYARLQSPSAKVHFQQVPNLQKLPFVNGEFDAALSVEAIGLVSDPRQALTELRRVTKPEGVVVAAVWDYGSGFPYLQLFWDAAVAVDPSLTPADGPSMPFSKRGELAQSWKEAGMRDITEQPLDIELSFKSFEDYWSPFLLSQGAAGTWLAAQTAEKRNAVRDRLRVKILGNRPDGPFTMKARAWAVRGIVRYN